MASTIHLSSPFLPIHDLPRVSLWHMISQSSGPNDEIYVDNETGHSFRFSEIIDHAKSLAYVLRHNLCLTPGKTVIVFASNSTSYAIVVLALLAAGLICSPASGLFQVHELLYQIIDSEASLVLCDADKLAIATQACQESGIQPPLLMEKDPHGSDIWDLADLSLGLEPELLTPDDSMKQTVLLCYSSGTSGKPKGCKLTHYNLTSAIQQALVLTPASFHSTEVWLTGLPMSHMYSLFLMVLMAPYIRAKVIVLSKFSLEHYASAIQTYRVTTAHIVPPIAIKLAKDLHVSVDLSSLREWRSAAAPLGQDLKHTLEEKYGVPIEGWYAMTETSAITALTDRASKTKDGSVGQLAPNIEAKLIDGELCLRGPNIFRGYNHLEYNNQAFDEEGFMHTGDIVHVDEDGFIFVVDRVKEMIKYNGYQVSPAEIEDILLKHPDVMDTAVVGIYDSARATELPLAFIVIKQTVLQDRSSKHLAATKVELERYVASQVAVYKKLRGGVVFLHSIPKSPSGKILRRHLRDGVKLTRDLNGEVVWKYSKTLGLLEACNNVEDQD